MDISHFELLFKPQSPADPIGVGPVATVVQGYFLEITNLEKEAFRFAVNLIAPEPDPSTPNAAFRSLEGNAIVFVDVPSADNTAGVLNGTDKIYSPSTGLITIPSEATALVAILPSVFPGTPDMSPIATPNFEVRGFVRLRLPPVFGPPVPPFNLGIFGPQGTSPVKVMVTAQNRTTYFDADGQITDQTQASVPICEGKACIEITPESAFKPILNPRERSGKRSFVEDLILQGDLDDMSSELAQMLSILDPKTVDLSAFNAGLKKAKIPFAIENRKV